MKRFAAIFAVAAFAFVYGCTSSTDSTPKPEGTTGGEAKTGSDFKVALLTPGPVSDAGWSAMAYDGLKAIESELGAKVSNQEAKEAQITDAMRSYAQDGYNLVIGHGFEYNEPGSLVSKDFPNTVFISSSGGKFTANSGAIRFYLEQGFYVAGYVAAKTSKTGKLAMIGGPQVPSIESTFKAFEAGAKAAKPDVVVKKIYTGENADVAKAKQATLTAIGEGADVVIHQANAGAQGVFDACKEKNVLAIGSNLDQNNNESGVVFCSAIISAKPVFIELAKRVKDKTYKGEVSLFGMKEGAVDFVWNPALKDKASAAVQEEATKLMEDIKSDKLKVAKDEF